MALYLDNTGDLWALDEGGPCSRSYLLETDAHPDAGWVATEASRSDVDGMYGPLVEIPAPPGAAPTGEMLGYIVATISDDLPVIEWSGEPQDTVTEAQTYVTRPGDVVVAVRRLPGAEPKPAVGGV